MSKVKITQVKSSIDRSKDQKATLVALGLKKMNQSREVELNPALEGMINKVKHLLSVENL
ncbi:MAG: 50S ribosomal protein L30 [Chitinophagales bacterium]|jgi:large subunit ribosomal protein L30|nr:50S ribosomal protein L30 [Sphingobacteriales bacterium]